ncbi:BamA/OMP85 family outer membrane protein [Blattabacterium cuenoti]|uniref:BamA/OMP85 family outer membrane protein n=1 Tax=Blattabacterium cuenoti TaxID=1653831 RepID=UPI00374D2377
MIKNIFIKGKTQYSIYKISQISNIHKGDCLNLQEGKTIDNAIHRLWNSNLFKNISIYKENIKNKKNNKNELNIYFELEDRISFNKIILKGVTKEIETYKFLCLNHNSDIISDDFIQKLKNEIIDFYIKQGYFKVSVISTNLDLDKNNNSLVVNVNLGKKISLSKIFFHGNKIFSDKELYNIMIQNQNNNDNYLYHLYHQGVNNIIYKYQSLGFRDIEITLNHIQNNKGNSELIVNVSEGKKYYIGNINFVGNTVYNTKYLKTILHYNTGDIYNKQEIENIILNKNINNSIIYNYLNLGYFLIKILILEKKIVDDKIYLEVNIEENHPVYVKNIYISGNKITSNHVIQRELKINTGDRLSIKKLHEDLIRLQSLDLFKIVYPKIIYHNNDLVDLKWKVIEDNHHSVKFMVEEGYDKNSSLGSLNFLLKNVSIKKLLNIKQWNPFPNPQGDGQKLLLYNKIGKNVQHYGMTFIDPWIKDTNHISYFVKIDFINRIIKNIFDPDFLLLHEKNNCNIRNCNLTNNKLLNKIGYSIGISKPLTFHDPYWKLDFLIDYDRYIYNNNNKNKEESPIYLNNLFYLISLKKFNKELTNIFPLSGSKMEINGLFTLPYSNIFNDEYSHQSWLEYFKIKSLFYLYKKIFDKMVLKTGLECGILGNYNNKKDLFAFQKFYMGDIHQNIYGIFSPSDFIPLRGYASENQNFNNPGGLMYNKYFLEMRYLIFNDMFNNTSNKLWANVFLEGGNMITQNSNQLYNKKMKQSIGFGFRCSYIPLGIFGVDFGYPLYPDEKNNKTWKIHFIMENNNE